MSPPSVLALRVALIALALVDASPLAAQRSSLGLDPRLLRQGTDSFTVSYIADGDTTRTGTIWDELRVVAGTSGPALERVYRTSDRLLGLRVDTLLDHQATLAPIRHRSRTDRNSEALDFRAGRAQGWLRLANGDSVDVDVPLAAAAYNASSFDLVLRSAPLAEGWAAEVPVFLPNTRGVATLRARVAGAELVAGEACWRVEAEFTGMPVTFWISRETRALKRQVMTLRPGAQILFSGFAPPRAPGKRAT